MSVLTETHIKKAMSDSDPERRIVITPLLDPKQIGDASVDLRLGHEFIVFNRSLIPSIDPAEERQIRANIHKYQQRVRIARREKFLLHPQQFVLGATLEYIVVPSNLQAQVSGRSTWGRTGLIIATATSIAAGFKGCVTLELVNDGVVPLVLRPGERIAQIAFQTTQGTTKYKGRYRCSTGPSFPEFIPDPDATFWQGEEGDKTDEGLQGR
ncbi:MAG: dCTP deaminase [Phycisphaerae bacterium]